MANRILDPESERLEFKSANHGQLPENAWMSISAFSNTDGGKILFGVKDDGEETGLSSKELDSLQKNFVSLCNTGFNHKIVPIYNHHPNINQAIVNNEKALLQKFSSGLDQQIEKLSKVTTDTNGRIFYAIMIFMARHDDVFFPVCTNINNQGLLYQIVEAAYPRLEISWLPVGPPAPCAGSERVESYLHKSVGIIRRWGKNTHCDVRRGGRYINSLLRATEDAARNRL